MPVYYYVGTAAFAEMIAAQRYTPGGHNELHTIFDRHFADMLRWNPHFHAIVLEGGFDEEGTFLGLRPEPPILETLRFQHR